MLFGIDPFREFDRHVYAAGRRPSAMPIDAFRRGEEFVLEVDLPGVDPQSIDVTVDRNVLTLRAERPAASAEGDRVVAAERRHGSFRRQLMLGEALDASRIAAHYEHGVLTVTVPVAETAKPRKVEVSVGTPAIEATAERQAA